MLHIFFWVFQAQLLVQLVFNINTAEVCLLSKKVGLFFPSSITGLCLILLHSPSPFPKIAADDPCPRSYWIQRTNMSSPKCLFLQSTIVLHLKEFYCICEIGNVFLQDNSLLRFVDSQWRHPERYLCIVYAFFHLLKFVLHPLKWVTL